MNSNFENSSPYFNEENEETKQTSQETSSEVNLSNQQDEESVNITNTEDLNPATGQVIADKINNEDPYVAVLREAIPEDVATRRRIAYNILRSMLATRKQVR